MQFKRFETMTSKIIVKTWFYPLALLFIGIIAYGFVLPRLGFYWDDWEGVYLYKLHAPAISFHYYSERPFSALAYMALFPLIKMTPLVTQVVTILLRWGGILFFYATLNLIWPTNKSLHRWIGALLFVFPGFLDQQVSVAFIPHLSTFLLFSCSLYLTALAMRDRKRFWVWMPVSVVLGIAQIFMMEYFVVLELLRPLVIGFILRDEQEPVKRVIARTFLLWLPFVVGLGVYLWWRLDYLPATLVAGDPNTPTLLKSLVHSPLDALVTLAYKILGDIRYLLLDVWANAFFNMALSDLLAKIIWLAWFTGLLAAILFCLYNLKASDKNIFETGSILRPVLFGLLAFLAGGIPVWLTNRQVSLGKWSDRFSLAPMLGIVVLVVYLIYWLLRTKKQKQWLLIILLGFSIAAQVSNANSYRLDWDLQRNIYWQLAWRIPSLKPGTAVIGRGTFTDKSSYYDGSYIMNLLFNAKPAANPNYAYFDVFHFLPDENGHYNPGLPMVGPTRSGNFLGTTSQAIGMYFNLSGGCVRVLDKVYVNDSVFTRDMNSGDRLNQLINVSDVGLIGTAGDPVHPDPAIFGAEPAHGWCYYFEKADLARQYQDWQTILQLESQAQSKGLQPSLGAEYLPFIEAHIQRGDWSKAYELSQSALKITKDLGTNLCNNWTQFAEIKGGTDRDLYLAQANAAFCEAAVK